jgi:hypothetical protein
MKFSTKKSSQRILTPGYDQTSSQDVLDNSQLEVLKSLRVRWLKRPYRDTGDRIVSAVVSALGRDDSPGFDALIRSAENYLSYISSPEYGSPYFKGVSSFFDSPDLVEEFLQSRDEYTDDQRLVFGALWDAYPLTPEVRASSKANLDAFRYYYLHVSHHEEFWCALETYKAQLARDSTEQRYTKNFIAFVQTWKGYKWGDRLAAYLGVATMSVAEGLFRGAKGWMLYLEDSRSMSSNYYKLFFEPITEKDMAQGVLYRQTLQTPGTIKSSIEKTLLEAQERLRTKIDVEVTMEAIYQKHKDLIWRR